MNGIDVSQWQGDIIFTAVYDAGIELVYIKASQGTRFVDPFFYRNYANAKNAGLAVGFYHYLTARSVEEARAEAYHFVSVIEGLTGEARPVMDIEIAGGLDRETINQIAAAFLEGVEDYSNLEPAIYADLSIVEALDESLTAYPLWIALYEVEEPGDIRPWESWAGWQYTDLGRVAGIQGNVDRDIFTEGILAERVETAKKTGMQPEGEYGNRTYLLYRVVSGDTLAGIARRFEVAVQVIEEENGIRNPNLVYPGQMLLIPRDS